MKLIKAPRKTYAEIAQQKKIRMSFAKEILDEEGNPAIQQMFYWMNCRDFFSDVLYAEEIKEEISKYGFNYNPEVQQIDRDYTKLLLNFSKREDIKVFKENLSILHNIEEQNGLEKTKIKYVSSGIYLIKGDKYWLTTTFLLHTYTLMLKVCAYPFVNKSKWIDEMKNYLTNEGSYISRATPKLEFLLSNLKKIFKNPVNVHGWNDVSISKVHDTGGFKSMFDRYNYVGKSFYNQNNMYVKRAMEIANG